MSPCDLIVAAAGATIARTFRAMSDTASASSAPSAATRPADHLNRGACRQDRNGAGAHGRRDQRRAAFDLGLVNRVAGNAAVDATLSSPGGIARAGPLAVAATKTIL